MAINTSSLFGMFALLGNAKSGNGFGVTVSGEDAKGAAGGLFSPFSLLVQQKAEAEITALATGNPVTDAKKKLMAANDALQEEEATDLSSPDLLLSDLLAVNWQAIQPGDTITLPNGWAIAAASDGGLTLSNETLGVTLPPFSAQQMQHILTALTAANPAFVDGIKPGQERTASEAGTVQAQASPNASSIDTSAPNIVADNSTRLIQDALSDDNRISVAKLVTLIEANNTDKAAATAAANATSTDVQAAQRDKRRDGPRESNSGITTANRTATATQTGKPDPEAVAQNRTNGMATIPADLLLHPSQTFETPSESDVQIAMQSFYNQFNLREVKPGTLMGASALSPQQLQIVVQKLARGSEPKTLYVQLDPIDLGRIQVEISRGENNTVKAHILAEKSEGLAALRADMASLEKALSNAGVNIDGGTVTMDLADQDEGGKSFTQQAFEELWKERNQDGLAARNAVDDELGTLPASLLINETYTADGRVNIRV